MTDQAGRVEAKFVEAAERIGTARVGRKQRSQDEIIMLIQFITRFVLKNNCSLTIAVEEAQVMFKWKRKAIFDIIHRYVHSTDVKPQVQAHKKRGRGAELFKQRWGDHFCVLKKNHASEILEYVRMANKQRGGMVTCGRIQAHLLQKYNKHFKRATIYYCLTRRLGLKYANSGNQRIVFTASRTRAAMVYCRNYDEAIKLERDGTHIRVFMDESYCHSNHMITRTWNEDGVMVNRVKSKGALMIMVHAMTIDGPLLPDGERYEVGEWVTGKHPTAEMVFRSKYAVKKRVKDYHDTMNGEMFMTWVRNRLAPAFKAKYVGKKMILILDNAPYHHTLVNDGFRPAGMSKEEIVERLQRLPRKRGLRRLANITVKPFADSLPPPPLPPIQSPEQFAGYIFLDEVGAVWQIDGVNDEGYGEAVVYARIGQTRAGSVESTLVDVFVDRLSPECQHRQRWYLLGYGDPAIRFARQHLLTQSNNKVPQRLRGSEAAVDTLREQCREHCLNERTVEYTYPKRRWGMRYNGNGFMGTGGPKGEWLRHAVDAYIKKHYPEMQETLLQGFFKKEGWRLVFTVPYWASSQPIEQLWAYVKNYVALRWFPGRTMAQLRSQIICGFYGAIRAGRIAENIKEPAGLKLHTGLTAELAQKLIDHSNKAVNDFINSNKYIKHMGRVGEWDRDEIDRLVIPSTSGMEIDELEEVDDMEAEVELMDEIENN